MKLSIATNWKQELIEKLSPYPIGDLYGSLARTPVGSGRPAMFLPDVTVESAKTHIQAVHDAGWVFNYLLNGMCVNGMDMAGIERDLYPHLEWISSLGITTVTVAHPVVLKVIKKNFSTLRVKMSILSDFDTVNKVRALEEMGADEIALSIMYNRDFPFLEAVAKATTCNLILLLNQACLYMCAHRLNHGAVNAHASREDVVDEAFGINYCLIRCAIEKLSRPSALIKSRWIRPEDLSCYESLGYHTFKIAGREMDTSWLVNTARAYSERRHDGDLSDLLNGIALLVGGNTANRKLPRIDNRALDGFIEQFETGRCTGQCVGCRYCERVADRAVELFSNKNKQFISTLEAMKETLI